MNIFDLRNHRSALDFAADTDVGLVRPALVGIRWRNIARTLLAL